jgi:hypothetical protein
MAGPSETILKAQLRAEPSHERALATLLEAVALWQGAPVRAALCADERGPSCGSKLYRAADLDEGGPFYSVAWVPRPGPRRRRGVGGLGDFRDLERLLVWEVAR